MTGNSEKTHNFLLLYVLVSHVLSNRLFKKKKKKSPLIPLSQKKVKLMNSTLQTTARILPESITHMVRNVECCLLFEVTNTVLKLVKVQQLPDRIQQRVT